MNIMKLNGIWWNSHGLKSSSMVCFGHFYVHWTTNWPTKIPSAPCFVDEFCNRRMLSGFDWISLEFNWNYMQERIFNILNLNKIIVSECSIAERGKSKIIRLLYSFQASLTRIDVTCTNVIKNNKFSEKCLRFNAISCSFSQLSVRVILSHQVRFNFDACTLHKCLDSEQNQHSKKNICDDLFFNEV